MAKPKLHLAIVVWVLVGIIGALVVAGCVMLIRSPMPPTPMPTPTPKQEVTIIVKSEDNAAKVHPQQYRDDEYSQIGVLSSDAISADLPQPLILPLFGKQMRTRRERWMYYAAAEKQPLWKVPVTKSGRNCVDDVGCEEIFDGDEVSVPIYKGVRFTATVYKKMMRSPFSD
jgi:hypothetical protein